MDGEIEFKNYMKIEKKKSIEELAEYIEKDKNVINEK
jgi:hypothetical protein